jgi:hypothetical protein
MIERYSLAPAIRRRCAPGRAELAPESMPGPASPMRAIPCLIRRRLDRLVLTLAQTLPTYRELSASSLRKKATTCRPRQCGL